MSSSPTAHVYRTSEIPQGHTQYSWLHASDVDASSLPPVGHTWMSWGRGDRRRAQQANAIGKLALRQRECVRALRCFRAAISHDASFSSAHLNVAHVWGVLHADAAAERQYLLALSLKPDVLEAMNALCTLCLRTKRPMDALTWNDRALQLLCSTHNTDGSVNKYITTCRYTAQICSIDLVAASETYWSRNTVLRILGRQREAVHWSWNQIRLTTALLLPHVDLCNTILGESINKTNIVDEQHVNLMDLEVPIQAHLHAAAAVTTAAPSNSVVLQNASSSRVGINRVLVVLVKWGTKYSADYVNRLARGIHKYKHKPKHNMGVTTDIASTDHEAADINQQQQHDTQHTPEARPNVGGEEGGVDERSDTSAAGVEVDVDVKVEVEIVCFTDDPEGLDTRLVTPCAFSAAAMKMRGWWLKAAVLFGPDLQTWLLTRENDGNNSGNSAGTCTVRPQDDRGDVVIGCKIDSPSHPQQQQDEEPRSEITCRMVDRIVYIDLDTVVVGSLNDLWNYDGAVGILGTCGMDNEGHAHGWNSSIVAMDARLVRSGQLSATVFEPLATAFESIVSVVHRLDHWLEMTLGGDVRFTGEVDIVPVEVDILQESLSGGQLLEYRHDIEAGGHVSCGTLPSHNACLVNFPLKPKPHELTETVWMQRFWI